jgi:hypothetical protein
MALLYTNDEPIRLRRARRLANCSWGRGQQVKCLQERENIFRVSAEYGLIKSKYVLSP